MLDRAYSHGRVFAIYKDEQIRAIATCIGPGWSLDSSCDLENPHYRYVQEHRSVQQKAWLEEVCTTHRTVESENGKQLGKKSDALFTGEWQSMDVNDWC